MKTIAALFAGIGLAVLVGVAVGTTRRGRQIADRYREATQLDLNTAARASLLALSGMDERLVDRIIENRPYRNKMELVDRMVIPTPIYNAIRKRVRVTRADEAVKVA